MEDDYCWYCGIRIILWQPKLEGEDIKYCVVNEEDADFVLL